MRRSFGMWVLALTVLAVSTSCNAQRFAWSSIRNVSYFQPLDTHLQRLVDSDGHSRINRICVIGQKAKDYDSAYVYWPRENKLILWEANLDDPDAISHSRRYLDLTRDVVEGDDVHGSSYLITRSWANSVIAACKRHGETVTVIKSAKDANHGR